MVRTAADRLRQGSRVTVRDLQKDWQFNGKSGRIEGRDGDRWAVKLDLDEGCSRVLRLLEANLQVVGLEETASLAKALTPPPPLRLGLYEDFRARKYVFLERLSASRIPFFLEIFLEISALSSWPKSCERRNT